MTRINQVVPILGAHPAATECKRISVWFFGAPNPIDPASRIAELKCTRVRFDPGAEEGLFSRGRPEFEEANPGSVRVVGEDTRQPRVLQRGVAIARIESFRLRGGGDAASHFTYQDF